MQLAAIVEALSLPSGHASVADIEVAGGYCSDLLSDVMGKAAAKSVWVTNQIHPNVVAVASLIDAAAVIIAGGVEPEAETLEKAQEVGIPLFATDLPAFEVVGRLYELGVRGTIRSV
ncbi:MAG: serine kinase [Firmicutes bacterium]|nr:serine kinase [Bacillota bacterium]